MIASRCFVIQPFGRKPHPKTNKMTDNDTIYDALRKLEHLRPTFPVIIERADAKDYEDDVLHEHIVRTIRGSDFCIADLNGQNSNVLYEIGIARGLGKRAVLICQNREDVPTDLRGFITVTYEPTQLDKLASDIAQHFEGIKKEVETLREKQQQTELARVAYFDRRDDANIPALMGQASRSINILQTNLAIIQSNYMPALRDALKSRPDLRLRILTLDPQSIFVNYRGLQVGFRGNTGLYREELGVNLRSVYFLLQGFGDRVQIRLYDDFPTQIAFFFDDEVLSCVVSATGRSRENCAFLLHGQRPGAKNSFVDHFDHLWKEENSKLYRPPA
jgi:hypothetical protein